MAGWDALRLEQDTDYLFAFERGLDTLCNSREYRFEQASACAQPVVATGQSLLGASRHHLGLSGACTGGWDGR